MMSLRISAEKRLIAGFDTPRFGDANFDAAKNSIHFNSALSPSMSASWKSKATPPNTALTRPNRKSCTVMRRSTPLKIAYVESVSGMEDDVRIVPGGGAALRGIPDHHAARDDDHDRPELRPVESARC